MEFAEISDKLNVHGDLQRKVFFGFSVSVFCFMFLIRFVLYIDSEEVPESSGQFATFGSPSGPYINSPHMDSTVCKLIEETFFSIYFIFPLDSIIKALHHCVIT